MTGKIILILGDNALVLDYDLLCGVIKYIIFVIDFIA